MIKLEETYYCYYYCLGYQFENIQFDQTLNRRKGIKVFRVGFKVPWVTGGNISPAEGSEVMTH